MIRQAFSCFDKDGKGFVSATDISRVLTESGEGTLSEEVCIEILRYFAMRLLVALNYGNRKHCFLAYKPRSAPLAVV